MSRPEREGPAPEDRPSHTNRPHSDSTANDSGFGPDRAGARSEQIASYDPVTLTSIGDRAIDLLTSAGHNQAALAMILAHALVTVAGNEAGGEVRRATHRTVGHGIGAAMLAARPEKAEGYADDCHARGRKTSSLAIASLELAAEAVLRGWVKP